MSIYRFFPSDYQLASTPHDQDIFPVFHEAQASVHYPDTVRISFDGFVNYEGRRFGVPYQYTKRLCRIRRDAFTIYIYDDELTQVLVRHNVTWSRRDSYCKDQYAVRQPEEYPSVPVRTTVKQLEQPELSSAFEKFNFAKAVNCDE